LSSKTFVYTGCENLEAMTEAKNYNQYLIGIIERSHIGGTKKILDFGAGSGTYADMLKTKGIFVDCLEPDSVLQEQLKKKGYGVVSDVSKLMPGSYDLIYSLNVFEHIDDDFENFTKITKALKSGGRVIIYVPAFQSLYSSMDKLVGHHRRYTKHRLRKMAEKAGVESIELHYCDPIGYAAAYIYKLVGGDSGVISPRSVKFYDRIAFPISKLIEPIFRNAFGKNVVLVARKNEEY
jgi:SAM-dependent methyltransferase